MGLDNKGQGSAGQTALGPYAIIAVLTAGTIALLVSSFSWGPYGIPFVLVAGVIAGNLSRNYRALQGFLALATVVVLYLLLMSQASIHDLLTEISESLISFFRNYGLLGAFLNSFIANASLIIQIPYPPIFIFLASQTTSTGYLIVLAMVGAIGSTLGESISYLIGRGVSQSVIRDDKTASMIKNIIANHPNVTFVGIILVAGTPLPDDLFIIPLGLSRYGLKRIIWPTLLGKSIFMGAIVYLSHSAFLSANQFTNVSAIDPSLFLLAVLLLLGFVGWQLIGQWRSRSGSINVDGG